MLPELPALGVLLLELGAEPVVLPELAEPVLAALFKRGCPVVLSLQCVTADTFWFELVDGEVED